MATTRDDEEVTTQQDLADDWTLTPGQMLFMLRHHNAILTAYQDEDMGLLDQLEASSEYKAALDGSQRGLEAGG
jgi:hypothetical protein